MNGQDFISAVWAAVDRRAVQKLQTMRSQTLFLAHPILEFYVDDIEAERNKDHAEALEQ